MLFLSKHIKEVILVLFLIIVYFFLRLLLLTNLPIFTDEAIYLRWAQTALNDANWRFISLTDGKQPMFVWIAMVFMKFFKDPVLAGRLVSVFSGFFTLVGIWFLTRELFKSKKSAYFTALLYIFFPFAQVYDRMAMMDSMVGAFSVWALYFSVLLVRKVRLDLAYTLGIVIGVGTLVKTNSFFSLYLLPCTLILFDVAKKDFKERLIKLLLYFVVVFVISEVIYNILRLSPFFHIISEKNYLFIYPFAEWIKQPLAFFFGNLDSMLKWVYEYCKVSYLSLIVFSLVLIKKFPREKLLLFGYFLAPFLALALFGRVIYPRFIFFMVIMLLPLAGWSLAYLYDYFVTKYKLKTVGQAFLGLVLLVVFCGYSAFTSYKFVVDPVNADIARPDSSQYINYWTAGWGVKESVSYLEDQAKYGKIFVATEGTFGLMPYSLELYMVSNPNITIKGYWPVSTFPKEALDYSKKMPSYFVFYQPQSVPIPQDFPLQLIFEKKEGNSKFYFRLYKIVP